MNHVRFKLVAGGLAIAAAVSFLAVAGFRDGWVYYLPVDEFLAEPGYRSQRVRLHGVVAGEDLSARPGLLQASFDLTGEAQRIRVEYEGVIPDQFMAGREVVVEGLLDERGVFRADTLLTKCASKYESPGGGAPHADPHRPGAERDR